MLLATHLSHFTHPDSRPCFPLPFQSPSAVAVRRRGEEESDSDSDSITSPEYRPAQDLSLPSPGGGAAPKIAAAVPAVHAAANASAAPETAVEAAEPAGCGEQLAAILARRDADATRLAAQLAMLSERERGAKQQRQQAAADSDSWEARIGELQAAEEQAVESEDYETAAALSSSHEQAKASLAAAQQQLAAAEQVLRSLGEQRLALVQKKAEVWNTAAEALRALHEAQEGEAAAAEAHSRSAEDAAAAAAAAAQARMQQLQQQSAELESSIEQQQADLAERQQQEESQLAGQREELAAAHATLEAEVEALRWVGALRVCVSWALPVASHIATGAVCAVPACMAMPVDGVGLQHYALPVMGACGKQHMAHSARCHLLTCAPAFVPACCSCRRAALAAKEVDLLASQQQLQEVDTALASLPERFAELASAIEADQRALSSCHLEAEQAQQDAEAQQHAAAAEQQAAEAAVVEAKAQLEAVLAAAAAAAAEAEEMQGRAAAEQKAAEKLAELRAAEEVAQQLVDSAGCELAAVQHQGRELAGRRIKLQHELGLAEAAAAAARWGCRPGPDGGRGWRGGGYNAWQAGSKWQYKVWFSSMCAAIS